MPVLTSSRRWRVIIDCASDMAGMARTIAVVRLKTAAVLDITDVSLSVIKLGRAAVGRGNYGETR
jgi:hypothetical protein